MKIPFSKKTVFYVKYVFDKRGWNRALSSITRKIVVYDMELCYKIIFKIRNATFIFPKF